MITVWTGAYINLGAARPLVFPYGSAGGVVTPPSQRGDIDYDQVQAIARRGDGPQFQMAGLGATPTPGHLLVYDSQLNAVDGGPPSAGSGTVTTTGSPATGELAKFSGATSVTNGDLSGDVTTSGTLATTIAASAVTYSKIQNVSANSKLLGSGASGSGAAPVEITLGTGLSMSGTTLNAGGYPTPTTITPSAVSSATITSCITSAYRDYEIRISDVSFSTAGASLQMQFSTDNGVTWDTSSSYIGNGVYLAIDTASVGPGNLGNISTTAFDVLILGSPNSATVSNSARYTLFNPPRNH